MFFWMLATILESLDTILWKKSLDLNKMPQFMFSSMWYVGDFMMAFMLMTIWIFNYELMFNYQIMLMILSLVMLTMFNSLLDQHMYSSEKVSALIPYEYLSSMFVMMMSFFMFNDVSMFTFWMTMLAMMIMTLFSMDFKNIILPKNMKLMFFLHSVRAMKLLTLWYLLTKISNFDYFSIFTFFFFMITLIAFIYKKYYKLFNLWTKKFYSFSFGASMAWTFWELLSLFMMSSLWLVMATLLWFLWLASTLILWYFMLKDKPEKKDILLALIVLMLISIWYLYK